MKIHLIFLLLFIPAFFFSLDSAAGEVLSHGLGQTIRKETENFIVELEYESPELVEGEPTEYVLRLSDKKSGKSPEFDAVNLRIADKTQNEGVFSVNLDPVGPLALGPRVYLALDSGEYSFVATFSQDGEEILKEAFDLTVKENEPERDWNQIAIGSAAGALASGIIGYLLWKRKS